jgi:hypothetical protein
MEENDRGELDLGTPPEEPAPEVEETGQEAEGGGEPEEQEPQPQAPGAVPYDRFQEVIQDRNQMKEANERLMRLLESQRAPQKEPEAEETYEDPETALKKANARIKQLEASQGALADRMDLQDAQALPGYDKLAAKVEEARRALYQQGKGVFSRREVFYYVRGQEAAARGVVPQPQAPQTPAQPQPVPRTRPAAQTSPAKGPKSLEQEQEDLKNVQF